MAFPASARDWGEEGDIRRPARRRGDRRCMRDRLPSRWHPFSVDQNVQPRPRLEWRPNKPAKSIELYEEQHSDPVAIGRSTCRLCELAKTLNALAVNVVSH